VTQTGMHTQIGHIATLIDTIEDTATNLQKKLADLSKKLGLFVLIVCAIVFISYYFFNHLPLSTAFLA
jgi:Ca2+-transporting ATPase